MIGVNKVILIGNLGKNPDVVTFPCEMRADGSTTVKKASFPLATTELHRNREGEKIEVTEWHNVVCWRGLADIAEKILRKGSQLYVEGHLQTRSWEDKEHNKRYITEVVADNFVVIGNRQRSDENPQAVTNDPLASLLNEDTEPLTDFPF